MSDRFFVLTGGPGAGKTSVVGELARLGYPTMPEAGRGVIREQVSSGGTALPWADRRAFAEAMLAWELRNHAKGSRRQGPVIFDRGIADIVGYLNLCGLPVPDDLRRAARTHRYNATVFVFPHWPEIYAQDEHRKQSPDEAKATFLAVSAAWREAGYGLVEVPHAPAADRARLILRLIDIAPAGWTGPTRPPYASR